MVFSTIDPDEKMWLERDFEQEILGTLKEMKGIKSQIQMVILWIFFNSAGTWLKRMY